MPTATKNLSLIPNVHIDPQTEQLKIDNYNALLARSKRIGNQYSKLVGSPKELRSARQKLNKSNRSLNDLRKKYVKPLRINMKTFKANIDTIRKPISDASSTLRQRLNVYKQQKIQRIKSHLKPVMHQICQSRHIKDIPIPSDALKLSMTKKKRLDILAGTAEKQITKNKMKQSVDVKGHAVNAQTGEVLSHKIARTLTFIGDREQLHALLKFAKDSNINLNIRK